MVAMGSPRVSVLVLHFNGLEDTRNCLRSLREDGCGDKEVLVLDNGSAHDASTELRAEFGGFATVLRSDKNLGYAGGNNLLARQARGEFLFLLNNDAMVAPGWLPPLLSECRPDVAVVQPKIRSSIRPGYFDYTGGCGGYLDSLGFPYVRGRIFDSVERDNGQYENPREIDWASGAAFLIRRDCFEEAGGFDADLFAYMEEIDLAWRLRRRGYRIVSAPASMVLHKGAQAMSDALPRKRFLEHRNNLLILVKNLPAHRAFIVLPVRLALEWCAAAHYLCSGQWRYAAAPVKSFFSFFRHLPSFIARRDGRFGHVERPAAVTSIITCYFFRGQQTWSDLTPADSVPPRPLMQTATDRG